MDAHSARAMELFGEVTPTGRHKAKTINFLEAYGAKEMAFLALHDLIELDYKPIEMRAAALRWEEFKRLAFESLGALPAQFSWGDSILGLWDVPGYPELTTPQLQQVMSEKGIQWKS